MSSSSQQPAASGAIRPTIDQVCAAAHAVGNSLQGQIYAIVGGAACALLGSDRTTDYVDVVVPQGATRDARQGLRSQVTNFDVESRTLHTYYKSTPPVAVEILTPPLLFREPFSSSTPIIVIGGTKVLKPTLILNAKCSSINSRASEAKRSTDAFDIRFCLRCPTVATYE